MQTLNSEEAGPAASAGLSAALLQTDTITAALKAVRVLGSLQSMSHMCMSLLTLKLPVLSISISS